jgi:hypothetical protein
MITRHVSTFELAQHARDVDVAGHVSHQQMELARQRHDGVPVGAGARGRSRWLRESWCG